MKLFLSLFFVLISVSISRAMNITDLTRSTDIAVAVTNFTVATGTIKAVMVEVTSGSVTYSSFQYFDSTASVGTNSYTSPIYNTSTTGTRFWLGRNLTNGFRITTTGTATLKIFWDFLYTVPKGQEIKGY